LRDELTLRQALTRAALRLILRKSTAVALALGVLLLVIFAAPYNEYFQVPSSHTAACPNSMQMIRALIFVNPGVGLAVVVSCSARLQGLRALTPANVTRR
jgi:hypothetical protein